MFFLVVGRFDVELLILIILRELDCVVPGKEKDDFFHEALLNLLILLTSEDIEQFAIINDNNNLSVENSREPSNVHFIEVLKLESEKAWEKDGF